MSNSNDISVQAGKATVLQHPDGTEVTAQEVYDAFMSGKVLLHGDYSNAYYSPIYFYWYDADGAQDDPANVVLVKITYINTNGGDTIITVATGTPS